ncbi:hypothetical protein ACFY30_22155 [Streptomyces sp. NPDC000345]|uniref:hypothetical protein n=1 Tax=Streptomyces sp. NPDC000345 TaxID=3364537 RepID=UPI003692CD86
MNQHEWTSDDNERAIPNLPAPRRPESYNPLYDPKKDAHPFVPTLQWAIDRAREVSAEKAPANIHDKDAMIGAAYGLHYVLIDLLAALDAERGDA